MGVIPYAGIDLTLYIYEVGQSVREGPGEAGCVLSMQTMKNIYQSRVSEEPSWLVPLA